jgi:hypothetical protein
VDRGFSQMQVIERKKERTVSAAEAIVQIFFFSFKVPLSGFVV